MRHLFHSGTGVAVTCVAGPTPEDGQPVVLAYVAACCGATSLAREYRWPGERASNRIASVEAALRLAVEVVQASRARGS